MTGTSDLQAPDVLAGADADLLRLVTCGSVDDGKSTLIGRLLYDTKQVFVDQMEHVEETSERRGDGYVNLALLTDGLRAEREQGITIDVAYRCFVTPRRRFQLADAPGHVQYTRNMVTGASTADVAVVLVDARKGVIEQTRRHTLIASLLAVPHLVFAVNKMDLVDFDESALRRDRGRARRARPPRSACRDEVAIPIAALHGDNVVDRSERMPWWHGPALLRAPRGDRARRRPQPRRPPLPRAVGDPADVGRAPRLPRLRGPGRRRRLAGRRRGRRAALRAAHARRVGRDRRRPDRRGRARRCRSRSGSRTRSTSPAATCSPTPTTSRSSRARSRRRVCWMSERPLQPGARARRQAHDAHGPRDRRGDRRRSSTSTRSSTREADGAGAERHRHRAAAPLGAADGRPVRREPRDGRVHPDRRGDERHRRRRHGALGVRVGRHESARWRARRLNAR